jgi:hypothetical protein
MNIVTITLGFMATPQKSKVLFNYPSFCESKRIKDLLLDPILCGGH